MTDAVIPPIDAETQTLFELGAHLGHKKNRLHPKARKFVYKILNGVSIIDLTMTVKHLAAAKKILAQYAKDEKVLLVVATKKIAAQYAAELCGSYNIPYITTKWLPGLLTNFDTIIKNVKKMNTYREQKLNGEWEKFVKHERVNLDKQLSKLEKFYAGLTNLTKKPDIIFVVDMKKEKNAVNEAAMNNIPVVAIADTNSNPDSVQYPIVINDDSALVMQYIIKDIVEAYSEAKIQIQNSKL